MPSSPICASAASRRLIIASTGRPRVSDTAATSGVRVALLTAAAPGAIAVIGVAGTGASRLLADIVRFKSTDSTWGDGAIRLCRINDGDETIDEGLVSQWSNGDAGEIH